MKRPPLNLLTVLSLLACVAAVALWVRSYWRMDIVHLRTDSRWYHVATADGLLRLGTWRTDRHDPQEMLGAAPFGYHVYGRPDFEGLLPHYERTARARHHAAGFQYVLLDDVGPHPMVFIPAWFLASLAAIMPAAAAMRWRRVRRRRAAGLCPLCGYDLTGNVSGVCPECGARK